MVPGATEEDVEERQLRRRANVLHLIMRAFLFGTDADTFELGHTAYTVFDRELD